MRRLIVVLLAACVMAAGLLPRALRAQAVETPEPFDSAGRVTSITPGLAAQLALRPPAWRIAGDYKAARLYRLGDSSWVVAVERRNGIVERYAITREDRDYLRAHTANVPPGYAEQFVSDVGEVARTVGDNAGRNAFIRNQSLLGLGLYAPSFAYAVSNHDAARVATYLLVAGGTYFGAATVSREMPISDAQNRMATDAALRGGVGGYGLAYALGANGDGRAASMFVGGLAGSVAGVLLGRDASEAQVEAGSFASTAAALTAGTLAAVVANPGKEDHFPKSVAAITVAAGAVGYPLGLAYPKLVRYNVTPGDVNTLWVTGALGMMATGTAVANGDHSARAYATTLTTGFLLGVVAGDRLLVSRFDHTRSQSGLVALGAGAGALMGAGVFVLVDRDRENNALALTLATLGGAGGVAASEFLLYTKADAGRLSTRLTVSPLGLAMAAGHVRGEHALLTWSF